LGLFNKSTFAGFGFDHGPAFITVGNPEGQASAVYGPLRLKYQPFPSETSLADPTQEDSLWRGYHYGEILPTHTNTQGNVK